MKQKLSELINQLDDIKDKDVIHKMISSHSFAYDEREFYVVELYLDSKEYWMKKGCTKSEAIRKARNNGGTVLKIGWTRKNVSYRFSDKRNGYIGIKQIYFRKMLNPKLCEELEKFLKKYTCGKKKSKHNILGKTEVVYNHSPKFIVKKIKKFIKEYKGELSRGRIN